MLGRRDEAKVLRAEVSQLREEALRAHRVLDAHGAARRDRDGRVATLAMRISRALNAEKRKR